MTQLLKRILGEDISLVSNHADGLPAIQADPGMMEQILLNLAVNSRDAMPGGGQLLIATGTEILEPETPGADPTAAGAIHVYLRVSDTGCGIAPEHLPHIFEPFFTTKEVGRGTGLGLATVHGIVRQHHGRITVSSEVGRGATFQIYFPAVGGVKTGKDGLPGLAKFPGGTETLLVVEDEFLVRLAVSKMLQRFGYTVLQAESGEAALRLWPQYKDQIRLLLTDVVMPGGLSGYELARQLLAEQPRLKVIYTSGYNGDLAGERPVLTDGVNFLQKPYAPQKLAEALRKNLDPG
jgi:CheY-like chemotaxis protein